MYGKCCQDDEIKTFHSYLQSRGVEQRFLKYRKKIKTNKTNEGGESAWNKRVGDKKERKEKSKKHNQSEGNPS